MARIRKKTAAERGVEMLIKKLNNQPYNTELIIPKQDRVPIAAAIKDLSKGKYSISNNWWDCTS